MSSFGVVVDANCLIPASLRDTILRAADAGLFRLYLSNDILNEVQNNLVDPIGLSEEKAKRLVDTIRKHFPETLVTKHTMLLGAMPVNDKDKHVLAAAVASQAQVIVTQNIKDFPEDRLAPFDIEAQTADDFLVHLFYLDPEYVLKIIIERAGDLRNPSMSALELLDILNQHVPTFAKLVRAMFSPNEGTSSQIRSHS